MYTGGGYGKKSQSLFGLTLFGIHRAKSVVAHFIHEAVEQDLGTTFVDTKFTSGGVVIVFLDVLALLCATANTHHPQELVNVCSEKTVS